MAAPSQGERIARLEEKVNNLVDDMAEVKTDLKAIRNSTGPTYSDLKALKQAVFEKLDLDALGNPKQYDKDNHPGRREEDSGKMPPVVVEIIKAIVIFVLGGTFLWLITDIFPRIFSVTTG